MDWREGGEWEVSLRHPVTVCSVVLSFGIFAWMGMADLFQQTGNYQLADVLYPWRVETKEQLMLAADQPEEIEGYARELLELNPYRAQHLQIIHTEEYEDYVADLRIAIESCEPGTEEYHAYVDRLLEVPELLADVEERTAALAYRIADKPDFSLSEDTMDYIESFR